MADRAKTAAVGPDSAQATASIREVIARSWPHRFEPGQLQDDVALGAKGLGLDSVEIVQVILACEQLWGQTATEELFAGGALTIERMAKFFATV